ncbi:Putative trans-acting enoyl reductase [BD1-7 clade bacterium]|uniref:Trans-acting enoyl reductase n=1 Tax=BD1-7 clade bacterium TaxID=2029982 RepID=A0A5S9QCV0_9GAMM|nr:Putative trans-acting enoyl reductase [BD1-7 clade bacterium]CAA0116059.1 Putative trans-acting enoyl reductase [BD1-7 clade bacterium]CAA0119731.1 Putative trans-acting enoyl reductase [BD1-7 clade bacterium]
MQWMIYGANGYTARLIAREAVRRGLRPILAGRSAEKIQPLADELSLPVRIFDLNTPSSVKQSLEGIAICLHCAGPFSQTAKPMRDAAISVGCHYLDITGEYQVLEDSYQSQDAARAAGSVVISGVGFDVVATDTLAALLKEAVPEATHLEMAFADSAGPSAGTAKTMLESLPDGLTVRQNGKLEKMPMGEYHKDIPFADKDRYCVAISWGDIVTAWHSTHIPNIRVYFPMDKKQMGFVRRWHGMTRVLKWQPALRFMQKLVERRVDGPSDDALATRRTQLWGRIWNESESVEKTLDVPQGYQYTVLSALFAVEQLLAHRVMPGAYTPSQAFDPHTLALLERENAQNIALEPGAI